MSEVQCAVACAVLSALDAARLKSAGDSGHYNFSDEADSAIAVSMGSLTSATSKRSDAARLVEQMVEGGVDLIQLRGKNKPINELADLAAELHELTAKSSTPLIVNDYAEIASRVPVEGVHVGQDDDSIEIARQKAARDILIGKSTHSLEQARGGAARRRGLYRIRASLRHAHKT